MTRTKSLLQLDKKYLWHPFTQQREWVTENNEAPLIITRARGSYLYDKRGKKYLDGISSLWTNLHGHRHPALDLAIRNQIKRVAHTTFLGLSHEPGILLAKELRPIIPRNLKRFFYSDNGSTAVEVALKMAFQTQSQSSHKVVPRPEFLTLENSYHGDTIGSVSVGGIKLFHNLFKPLLFKTHKAMSPHCLACPHNQKRFNRKGDHFLFYQYRGEKPKPGDFRSETHCHWECLGEVEKILTQRHREISAAIIEPVVQGAGGVLVMPAGYLWGFSRLCRKFNILLIADEVASGFGRTGKMFACQQEKVQPDILCLAKGITGGYLPLAVTITTERIYRSFLGRYEEFKAFFHGHTYTANPLACEAARANIRIFHKTNPLKVLPKKISFLREALRDCTELPNVGAVRQAGLFAGIEIVKSKRDFEPFPPSFRAAKKICNHLRKVGVILRPLGDVVVLMPPLSVTINEIRFLVGALKKTLLQFGSSRAL